MQLQDLNECIDSCTLLDIMSIRGTWTSNKEAAAGRASQA